ncbi:MAG: hypothetical protein ACREE9_14665 [Stellaceae bacterium]
MLENQPRRCRISGEYGKPHSTSPFCKRQEIMVGAHKIMVGFLIAKCEPCNALVVEEVDKGDPEHVICKSCGAKLSPIFEPGTRMDGKFWRDGLSRTKGLLGRVRVAFEPQHSRGGVLARLERFIDRNTDRYFEKVTMCDSGEIVHECDEPLSDHRGHGSAKK